MIGIGLSPLGAAVAPPDPPSPPGITLFGGDTLYTSDGLVFVPAE